MDLIDREELLKTLCNFDYVKWYYSDLADAIINMPTVDAEQVVRCKYCYYRGELVCPMYNEEIVDGEIIGNDYTEDDGFCYLGTRMDGE